MRKIYGYECKRLLLNRFFFGLLAIMLFYGWQVLNRITIMGIDNTAPFSVRSFGDYLCRMVPIIWMGAALFICSFASKKAKNTAVITNTTAVPPKKYLLTRFAAAFTGTELLVVFAIAEAGLFYGMYFNWYGWGELALTALVIMAAGAVPLSAGLLIWQINLVRK